MPSTFLFMNLSPFPFTLKFVIGYQITLSVAAVFLGTMFSLIGGCFVLLVRTQFSPNPSLNAGMVITALLSVLINLMGAIAGILLFQRVSWAWFVSLNWHGFVMISSVILWTNAMGSNNYTAKGIMGGLGPIAIALSAFSLVYLSLPQIKDRFTS
jgi:hypothetical protein